MVRDFGRARPGAPEIDGGVQGVECLVLGSGNAGFSPGKGDEADSLAAIVVRP